MARDQDPDDGKRASSLKLVPKSFSFLWGESGRGYTPVLEMTESALQRRGPLLEDRKVLQGEGPGGGRATGPR